MDKEAKEAIRALGLRVNRLEQDLLKREVKITQDIVEVAARYQDIVAEVDGLKKTVALMQK